MSDFPKRDDRMGLVQGLVHAYLCTQATPGSLYGVTIAGYWLGEREFNDIVLSVPETMSPSLTWADAA